jgi:subtilase family serine protease
VVVCALVAIIAASTGALAARPAFVRLGSVPAVPAGARVLGPPAPDIVLHVTLALRPRDPLALTAFATSVSTPGSSVYRHYLTVGQFARRFGATRAQIAAVEGSLRARGLHPGPPSANGLAISVTATTATLERALSVSLARVELPGRAVRAAMVNRDAPALDPGIAGVVQQVVGLDTASSPQPLLIRTRPGAAAHAHTARPDTATGGPRPCAAAAGAAAMSGAYTPDQLASAYGLPGLYTAGDEGRGQTIALYELEPDDPNDIAGFQACYGTHASISYVPVDGGAGSGVGSGEATLDIETVLGLAPDARLLVYQAPNSNSSSPGSGPYDALDAIVSQNRARVVSISWGQCESLEGTGNANAESMLFEEAAIQGQTVIAASGDDGSEDCFTGQPLMGTELAVDDPASQQFVTGVGGTQLLALGSRPTEVVWNGGGSLAAALLPGAGGAGGGGNSRLWQMPSYQVHAPASLHVINGSTARGCRGTGYCREVPDVSADADPQSGYLVYWNGSNGDPTEPTGWQPIGGTSLSAPLWAAVLALANASRACHGTDIGFANPALYRAAAAHYAADFNDVTSGNNDFTGTNGSRYGAGTGYDLASGLGSPNASALAPAVCGDTFRIANPGPQRSTVDTRVRLRVRSRGTNGATVRYTARGLPRGLSISRRTGVISGEPHRSGLSHVTVLAAAGTAGTARATFTWSVRRRRARHASTRSGPS